MTADTFPMPILTVDVVLLTLLESRLHVALAKRPNEPFAGQLALPGGYVRPDEDASTAETARRVLRSKIGFDSDATASSAMANVLDKGEEFSPAYLEQAFTVSGQTRDPRGWSASVVYLALHAIQDLEPLIENGLIELHAVDTLPDLAFDHGQIIAQALRRLRAKAGYTSISAHFLGQEFTIPEVQAVYEVLTGLKVNAGNFRRKILETGALVETEMLPAQFRPAQGYRLKEPITDFGQNLFR